MSAGTPFASANPPCAGMSPTVLRIVVSLVLAPALVAVPAAWADGPTGQFQPSAGDRDGDRLADADDCAPDDPSRPAQSGQDADCDGAVDGQGYSADSTAPAPL